MTNVAEAEAHAQRIHGMSPSNREAQYILDLVGRIKAALAEIGSRRATVSQETERVMTAIEKALRDEPTEEEPEVHEETCMRVRGGECDC